MEIRNLVEHVHNNAVKKGFWDDYKALCNDLCEDNSVALDKHISTMLMLIVTEIAEAQEGLRHGNEENFKEELADAVIRIFDLCGGLKIDIETEILKKHEINKNRPRLHGKKF